VQELDNSLGGLGLAKDALEDIVSRLEETKKEMSVGDFRIKIYAEMCTEIESIIGMINSTIHKMVDRILDTVYKEIKSKE